MNNWNNEKYREEQKRTRQQHYKRYHYCGECGYYSKEKLIYGHPDKDRMICKKCRDKLWR